MNHMQTKLMEIQIYIPVIPLFF